MVRSAIDADGSRVRRETEDYLYYWWFNELPVYRTDTLGEFFSWLDEGSRREAVFGNWCCFDYIVYVMWLIECRGAKLKKIDATASCGITEELFAHKHDMLTLERDCGLHWTSRGQINSEIVMKFHLDRKETHESILRRLKNAIKRVLRILKLRR